MGTGLGPESYAIIEQGRIGQILSSKPTDRRAILEEAAGITKFKTKKRLAEARLEDARQNLNRVNDIFEEVTRQMNSLKRQAAKTSRHVRLRDEMRAKLRVVLASKFAQLEAETSERQTQMEAIGEEIHTHTDAVQLLETEQSERTQCGYGLESALRENTERLAEVARDIDRTNTRQKQNEERCRELEQRAQEARQEVEQTQARLELLRAEGESNRKVLDSAEADVAATQQQLQERQQDAVSATTALSNLEKQQETRRSSILEAANAAANVRNRIIQAEENMAALARDTQRLSKEIEASQLQLEGFGGERAQLALEFESASQRVQSLAEQITDARRQLEQKRQAETEGKRRFDKLRTERASAQGKKSSLEAVIVEHGYSTDSVRRLFKSGTTESGFVPLGVLADFLEVDDQYEYACEDFLRDELNYVVVKSWDAAGRGLDLLRSDVNGRATFLVHPDDAQIKFPFLADAEKERARSTVPPRDGLVPLKNCVRALNGFGNSLEVLLPKLRDGYFVADAALGRELAVENPDAFFLAPTGECFHNLTVTGGMTSPGGPLSLKRELRDVLRHLSGLEQELQAEETRVQILGHEIGELVSRIQGQEDQRREAEKQAMTGGHALRQLEGEITRTRQRFDICERELVRIRQEHMTKENFVAELREQLARREQTQAELEQSMSAAQQELAELRSAKDNAAQQASEVRAQMAALEERRRAAAQAVQRLNSLISEMAGRAASLDQQIVSAAKEKQQREAENQGLAGRLNELTATGDECRAQERELRRQCEQVRARLAEIEAEVRDSREKLDQARDRRGEIAAELAKLESDAAHMAETCINELGISREQLRTEDTIVPVSGEDLNATETEYRELRTKIDNLGPVNMMALDEFNEVAQRHEFLDKQQQDLLESIHNTQETIREIEVITRQKFNDAFAAINANFQVTFRKLFGGGDAFMKLTDEQNSMESGIDVVASPPGKRLQNVLLLSGGEKALTALSLLVGIFQYQPSPFCILDEVDAPLDDSNVGRFTQLVREMSSRTQFILITHSKKTMGVAPVMYGVTMQEPGVSRLVSVRFGEMRSEAVN